MEKEACKSPTELFNVLKEKFRTQHNGMILLLQNSKWQRRENESTWEWMGRLHIKAAECNYKDCDRQLKEQFINNINKKPGGLWHTWKNMFLQFFEDMMTSYSSWCTECFCGQKVECFISFLRNIPKCYVFTPFATLHMQTDLKPVI